MKFLTDLDSDALKLASDCAGELVRFKAYLPRGGLVLMLIGKFRDDVLEAMDADRGDLPKRGTERHPLDELTSTEFDTVSGAVGILVDRFTDFMDDPALPRLLREFRVALNVQRAERVQAQAAM